MRFKSTKFTFATKIIGKKIGKNYTYLYPTPIVHLLKTAF